MGTTADLRPGAFIRFNNELCQVLESQHRTPGNLRAFYQVKMRNTRSGKLLENRFRSGESIEFVRVDKKQFQFLYRDGNTLYFMDQETYDQIPVNEETVGESVKFLKENQDVFINFEGDIVLGLEMPPSVSLRIIHTEPGVKGDTATNVVKPATVETGALVNVPLFINEGDLIRVDTSNGAYMDRVKE
ncbi:elongation factor P [Candidatus Kapaibacterium sp.]